MSNAKRSNAIFALFNIKEQNGDSHSQNRYFSTVGGTILSVTSIV